LASFKQLENFERQKIKYIEQRHKIINGVKHKICGKHYVHFPEESPWFPCTEEYFYKDKMNSIDGLNTYCKECAKKDAQIWRRNNPEKWTKSFIKQNNRPERKILIDEAKIAYRKSGKKRIYDISHPEKIKQYSENRKHKKHNISKNEWINCKKYFNNECAYCGLSIEDHYFTRLGITKNGDFHKEHYDDDGSNTLDNCIPSCGSCNSRKWKFSFEEWYIESNPIFSKRRLNKIIKWLNEDYNLYIINKNTN